MRKHKPKAPKGRTNPLINTAIHGGDKSPEKSSSLSAHSGGEGRGEVGVSIDPLTRFTALLAHIYYKGWTFYLGASGVGFYLQLHFVDIDATTGCLAQQSGRKWLLSEHMTDGEVLQTALMAVLAAEEHETREQFTWRGQAIFGPHYDITKLHSLCKAGATVVRKPKNQEAA